MNYRTCLDIARSEIRADVDSFADWLYAGCMHAQAVSSAYESRLPSRLAAAALPVVLHAALEAANRNDAESCLEAMRLIVSAYEINNAERVSARASEIGVEA